MAVCFCLFLKTGFLGSKTITPPTASPPYLSAFAPTASDTPSTLEVAILGACSAPHSISCILTPWLLVSTLLPYIPWSNGLAMELPVLRVLMPCISVSASAKLWLILFSKTVASIVCCSNKLLAFLVSATSFNTST